MSLLRQWRWAVPGLALMLVLVAWPLLSALWQSMFVSSASVPADTHFAFLANYGAILGSGRWWQGLVATLAFSLGVVATELVLGVAFAAALRGLPFGWSVGRFVVLLPVACLSLVTAVAVEYAVGTGFLNAWLRLGEAGDSTSLAALGIAEVWRGTGFVVVIVHLAAARVSPAMSEAAAAAGAGLVRRARRLWWPAVAPAIGFAFVFRLFDTLRIVEGPVLRDGPGVHHRPLTALLWHEAFESYEQGLAAASAVALIVVTAAIAAAVVGLPRLRRRRA